MITKTHPLSEIRCVAPLNALHSPLSSPTLPKIGSVAVLILEPRALNPIQLLADYNRQLFLSILILTTSLRLTLPFVLRRKVLRVSKWPVAGIRKVRGLPEKEEA